MFRRSKKTIFFKRGSVLAGTFMVCVALAIAMETLLSSSRSVTRETESLLCRAELSRMAQEKFTRDRLALLRDNDLTHFSTSAVSFAWGEAQSFLSVVPPELLKGEPSLYVVVVATLTKNNRRGPLHVRLETLLGLPASRPAVLSPPPAQLKNLVSKEVDDRLRSLFPNDDEQIEEIKKQILSQLQDILGSDLDSLSLSIETNEYRDSSNTPPQEEKSKSEEAFYRSPVSVEAPKSALRIRLWKETYY